MTSSTPTTKTTPVNNNPVTRWFGQTKVLKGFAIASLASQIGIVVTGGAVRLTKSGLGCSTWPQCTPDSTFPVAENGIHGFIEFGNRLMTFVLLIIALCMIVSVLCTKRRDILPLSISLALGVPGQAILGMITVFTGLNPWVVGLHFVLSMVLIAVATIELNRVFNVTGSSAFHPNPRFHSVQARYERIPDDFNHHTLIYSLAWMIFIFTIVSIALGIILTGSGPHAGDAQAPRNGLSSEALVHLHSLPVYLLLITTIVLLITLLLKTTYTSTRGKSIGYKYLLSAVAILLSVDGLQTVVGLSQNALGLPVILVGLHLLEASLAMSTCTNLLQRARVLRKKVK